ncbi:NAD(P)-binding protein [Candidatus Woesebacteria bacterium]|nr:NAD(P)-binding protein [Candidatus Woesebacteria bacterium]
MKNLEHNNAPLLADHTVVGGGIAGLAAAIELAKLSSSVALIEPRIRPDLRSLFVRGDVLSRLPDMDIDLNTAITGWQYHAAASNTNLNFKLPSPHNESEAYFMIDHQFIIDAMKKSFLGLGGTIVSEGAKGKIARVTDYPDKAIVQFSDGNLFQTGRVIDATGKQSSVLRNTFNSENLPVFNEGDPIVMWVFGRCFESGWPDNLDKTLFTPVTTNAGRVSWAAPYGDNRFDVVASDYCRLSDLTKPKHVQTMKQMFQNLLDICHSRGIHPKDKGKTIFGAVRLMPMKKNSSHNVMAVGEAAGYPSPFMAESITPALVHAPMTARMAVDGTAPATHLQHWKQKKPIFPYKAEAALLHRRLSNKTAGSNAPFYAQGTANLNEDEQRILLHDRKVGFSTLLKRAPALFLDKDFLFWSAKVGATLLTLLANDGQYTEKQAKQHLFPGINYQIDNQE